jgi:hypothetical protein
MIEKPRVYIPANNRDLLHIGLADSAIKITRHSGRSTGL